MHTPALHNLVQLKPMNIISMNSYVLGFRDIDKSELSAVGGKGANLGELCKIDGINVPQGFCITTRAFNEIVANNSLINELLDQLAGCRANDREKVSALSGRIRAEIERLQIPNEMAEEVSRYIAALGEEKAYAVRSSATAEDLPTASFAGQQDTYLNIIGRTEILKHISRCWASLFTDRAVIYRLQNGFDHRKVQLSVVVQLMVFPEVAGIMFTADPVTGNRKTVSIDASLGLGEALVSGLVNADVYKVNNNRIADKQVAVKKLAVKAQENGGTAAEEIGEEQQRQQALTDEQILQLATIGKSIAAYFGQPQDIEWCLANGSFYIVQSRPITTLFPVPEAGDDESHVYVSVGHQQMMTDPLKPLGIAIWQLTAPRPMHTAAGRLFVDIARNLASPGNRDTILDIFGKSDPLIKDALLQVVAKEDFIKPLPDNPAVNPLPPTPPVTEIEYNPTLVEELIRSNEADIATLRQQIAKKSGTELFDFIVEDLDKQKKDMFNQRSLGVVMAGINASFWVNDKMNEWLGEKNAVDVLTQSVPHNITSEMGLALLDVADVIRPYPEVISYLQRVKDDNFLEDLGKTAGGEEAANAITRYLDKYGMRCVGEIDITKTRWSEKPAQLIPLILSNIRNFEPGAGRKMFEKGLREANDKGRGLLERLRQLPDGEKKAAEAKHVINLVRNYIGYREYPKYAKIVRYYLYKQALMKEAAALVKAGVIHEPEDVYYLGFHEFREAVNSGKLDYQLIEQRKEEYRQFEKLTPPRVMTSEGEIMTGRYKNENLPANAIVGLAVSSGVVEGRARVILKMEDADLEDGDILVTLFTDPSWTPLFVSVKGLITEVGGLMTHGAVIAREYGLPAVVGVLDATKRIRDKQRIRVNGTEGYVEIL